MRLERLKRWQWMIVGLIVGAIVAYVRQMYTDDVLSSYGNTMNSIQQFETALTLTINPRTKQYANPIPAFKDLVVYPAKVRDRMTLIVAGKYCEGRPERTKSGGASYIWHPYCFIQEKPVYKTHTDFAKLTKANGPDFALQWKAISDPTVLDYLKVMHEAKGINFRYAWWAEPKKSYAIWMGTGFVSIGVIWPFLVCLIAFGTLKAPPEEKGIDLRKVVSVTPATEVKTPKSAMTDEDMDQVERLGRELEEKLAAELSENVAAPAAAAAPAGPAPIKQLTATKLETSGVAEQKDDKAFGAGADDFYPTERKAKPNKPE